MIYVKDRFGREINYLRLSLTDRCNLRCVYCMPMHGLTFVPGPELLTAEELEKVVRAAVDVGFNKVRLTGGEPTLRTDIVEIVRRLAQMDGVDQLVMTTNGYRLAYIAQELKEVGLKRVNIHVDSWRQESLQRTMRLGTLDKVWAGIEASEQAGLTPIKLNAVITRGYNDDAAVDLARLTLTKPWQIRFIELMPFGGPTEIQLEHYVSSAEVKTRIEAELGPLFEINEGKLDGEARVYRLAGSEGAVGFISPVSDPYCDDCNRMRLTADGRLRMCLLTEDEINFRSTLRGGGTHQDLVALFEQAIHHKPVGHQLRNGHFAENRTMSQIGG
jgi:cyclic pyranopterin phosphate synthase